MGAPRDLTGQRFGRLTALTLTWRGEGRKRTRLWGCSCDCGGSATVAAGHLWSGHTQSCGCMWRDTVGDSSFKHGLSTTPEMYAYWAAKNRCENPEHPSYRNYGGRGIQFRFASFDEFFSSVGPRPAGTDEKGKALYSLDRIKNERHYEHGNLRWATKSDQMKNSRAKPPRKMPYSMKKTYSTLPAPIPV